MISYVLEIFINLVDGSIISLFAFYKQNKHVQSPRTPSRLQ